jgi:hypothetical protein
MRKRSVWQALVFNIQKSHLIASEITLNPAYLACEQKLRLADTVNGLNELFSIDAGLLAFSSLGWFDGKS